MFPKVYMSMTPVLGRRELTILFAHNVGSIFGAGVPASRFGFSGKVELQTYDSSDQS